MSWEKVPGTWQRHSYNVERILAKGLYAVNLQVGVPDRAQTVPILCCSIAQERR